MLSPFHSWRKVSHSSITFVNSLVHFILHSETSQTQRSTVWKHACGNNHLWLSFSVRKGRRSSCIQQGFTTFLSKSNKSSVIKKYLSLKPKHCNLSLLLPKWATTSTSGTSRHICRDFYIWQSQEVYKWTYHPRLWPEPAMEEPTLSKTWCCVNSRGTEMQ